MRNDSTETTNRSRAGWPVCDNVARRAITTRYGGLPELWESSPRRFEDNKSHTEEIIDGLFAGDHLLCCGWSLSHFATRPLKEWRRRLYRMQFVVPSPMLTCKGLTRAGKLSEHSLQNTGYRRFLVVEFDDGTVDDHASLLLHLATRAPLALANHSGGKSLHGWFYCVDQSETKLRNFMHYAVSLGADSATWIRSQFVRMPDGRRPTGTKQTAFFFNPDIIE